VTVVIPVKDRDVSRTIATLGPVGRVLVVDDGSSPPVPVPAGVEVVRRPVSGGPAAARTSGLSLVTSPLVAFVDSDVTPTPGWLAPLLTTFADDRVALVAPRVRAPVPEPGTGVVGRYEAWRSALDLGPAPGPIAPRTRIAYVPAAALVCRVAALQEVGGFDETLQVGEDVDLVWRLHEAGFRCRYEPDAVVHHDVRDDLADWWRRRVEYGTSAGPLARRHPGALAPLGVSAWSAGAWALVAAGHPVAGFGVTVGSTMALVPKLRGLAHPVYTAVDLAGRGHLGAARPIASALTRAWWPLTVMAAVASRRVRRAALAAALVPPLAAWWRGRPRLDPVRATAMYLAEDVAYGTGVWLGAWRERTWAPLWPDLRSWPGRAPAVTPAG
jgi:mycofactocin system glycosyltransferase